MLLTATGDLSNPIHSTILPVKAQSSLVQSSPVQYSTEYIIISSVKRFVSPFTRQGNHYHLDHMPSFFPTGLASVFSCRHSCTLVAILVCSALLCSGLSFPFCVTWAFRIGRFRSLGCHRLSWHGGVILLLGCFFS